MSMFCFQCEQAACGTGCSVMGNCGKDPETAALQDLLVEAVKAISMYAARARSLGFSDLQVDRFIADALFTTVTNVNFDPERMETMLRQASQMRDLVRKGYETACRQNGTVPEQLKGPADWTPAPDRAGLVRQGREVTLDERIKAFGADLAGLQELLVYGIKGTAAYAVHARILGREDFGVHDFFTEALNYLAQEDQTIDQLLELALRCGKVNLRVMEMLDKAHTSTYGHPQPTQVRITSVKGKAILVSGHDLKDLQLLLEQTAGKGINIYTHGEMLPAHGYPELKKYPHLVGNYGGAWQDQMKEFEAFPGAILMTTNCIQKPRQSYQARIFTSGLVAWPGVQHIEGHDFTPVIEAALSAGGFMEDQEEKTVTVGFGHNAILGVANKIVDAVQSGAIKHFFLIGGCDGARPGRSYYSDFARAVPQDSVILTLACGKYRFNKDDFGDIGGIPRLLDMGQCNDAYSAIKVAGTLADAFGCGVNDLPLSMILSWYEQKAVCILLTLLALGIKHIRLGPTLPTFVSPAMLNVLVEQFNLMPIKTVEEDLRACLAAA